MSVETDQSLISNEAWAWMGRELACATGTVVKQDFQRFAAAVKDRNPLYFDEEYAKSKGYRDVIAPPTFVHIVTLGVDDLDTLRPDGVPAAGGEGEIPLPNAPRRMAAGEDATYFEPLYDGDEITMVQTCSALVEKQGRSGAFVLMTTKITYTRSDGTLIAEVDRSTVARPL